MMTTETTKTVHMSRLAPGTQFRIDDLNYTLVDWSPCCAAVTERTARRLVAFTDRYGNEAEFVVDRKKVIRITSDIYVQVDIDTEVLSFVDSPSW